MKDIFATSLKMLDAPVILLSTQRNSPFIYFIFDVFYIHSSLLKHFFFFFSKNVLFHKIHSRVNIKPVGYSIRSAPNTSFRKIQTSKSIGTTYRKVTRYSLLLPHETDKKIIVNDTFSLIDRDLQCKDSGSWVWVLA